MKNTFIKKAVIFLAVHGYSQEAWQWAKSVDVGFNAYYTSKPLAINTQGEIYMSAYAWNSSTPYGGPDSVCLLKFNSSGSELWRRYFPKGILINEIVALNNSIYLSGDFRDTITFSTNHVLKSRGGLDGFIACFDALGIPQWIEQTGGKKDDEINSLSIDSDKNIWYTGSYSDTAFFAADTLICQGDKNMFIAKCDTNGNQLYLKSARSKGNYGTSMGRKIRCGPNDNIYILGEWNEMLLDTFYLSLCGCSPYTNPEFLTMLDKNGTVKWLNGSLRKDITYFTSDIDMDGAGNVYTTGSWDWTSNTEFYVNRFDRSDGKESWSVRMQRGYGCYFASGGLAVNNDAVYTTSYAALSYYQNGSYPGDRYLMISHHDTSGHLLNIDTIPSDNAIEPERLIYNPDGNYFLANGYFMGGIKLRSDSINGQGGNIFLAKFQRGSTSFVFDNKSKSTLSIFPNPSTGKFKLNGVGKDAFFKISDARGEKVLFQNQDQSIDMGEAPKGLYFLEVTTPERRSISKIMVE